MSKKKKKYEVTSFSPNIFLPKEVSDLEERAKNHIKKYLGSDIICAVVYFSLGISLMIASWFINRNIEEIKWTGWVNIAFTVLLFIFLLIYLFMSVKLAKVRLTITSCIYNSLIKDSYLSQDAVTFDFRRAPILFLKYIIDKCDYIEKQNANRRAFISSDDNHSKKKRGLELTGIISIITILFNPRGEKDGPSLFDSLVTFISPVFSKNSELFLRLLLLLLGVVIIFIVLIIFPKKIPPLFITQPEYDLASLGATFAKQELDRRLKEVDMPEEHATISLDESCVADNWNILTSFKKVWKSIWK